MQKPRRRRRILLKSFWMRLEMCQKLICDIGRNKTWRPTRPRRTVRLLLRKIRRMRMTRRRTTLKVKNNSSALARTLRSAKGWPRNVLALGRTRVIGKGGDPLKGHENDLAQALGIGEDQVEIFFSYRRSDEERDLSQREP